ncbi:AraC-like ligand-binding domain-containing protein [Agrococcus jejuensis]|uniref:AraC-type DNA-binding protein n=1 Tax=Agrococcus jejuensis TaxID=399736 RepID=A0A1G8FXG5_9MICO|nr:helix-turn-helix domain-containing protein [Agrococcus jejuensis]SDH86765.1 AraC-type DNA-binding protein [Agrococcus jejuensis]
MEPTTILRREPSGSGTLETGEARTFEQWRQLVSNRFVPLDISSPAGAFHGTLRALHVGDSCVTEIVADPHRVEREATRISPDDPHHLKLTLQLEGTGIVAQDGRQAVLQPGDVAIYDTSRPYTLEFETGTRSLVMMFPHRMLGLSAQHIHRMTAVRLPGDEGIGTVICPFMQHMAAHLDELRGAAGVRILRSALDLVTALISAELDRQVAGTRRDFERCVSYVEEHLGDAGLNTAQVASACFLSSRTVQYLFSEEGTTVSTWVRERRLERCRTDLQDAAQQSTSVLEIAHRWGFTDAAHFSRVCKAAFGASPRELRRLAG